MSALAEQETIIRWDQEGRIVHLYTAHPATARKWARLGYDLAIVSRTRDGEPRSWKATAPWGVVTVRKPAKRTVQLSDEERQRRRERLTQARKPREFTEVATEVPAA